jgi:hypothetical protein
MGSMPNTLDLRKTQSANSCATDDYSVSGSVSVNLTDDCRDLGRKRCEDFRSAG